MSENRGKGQKNEFRAMKAGGSDARPRTRPGSGPQPAGGLPASVSAWKSEVENAGALKTRS
jgi:hypothetical protein